MVVDVPSGKAAAEGDKVLTLAERQAVREINGIEARWDEFVQLREEGKHLREGTLDADRMSHTYREARHIQLELREQIELLVGKVHEGTPEANTPIRDTLIKAVQVELLLLQTINGLSGCLIEHEHQ